MSSLYYLLMKRRIIKQGNNSYTLTLPISWIKENHLRGGDEIEIDEEDSKLIISLSKDQRKVEISLDVDVSNYNSRSIIIILP